MTMLRPHLLILMLLSSAGGWACSKGSTSFDEGAGGAPSHNSRTCGNGRIDPGEDCEVNERSGQVDLDGETCEDHGFATGMLACDPQTCTFDTSMCEGRLPMGATGG
jgi:hypothetical protein